MGIDVKNMLLEGERATLECKKASKCVPSSVWNTYSAFANTNGGIILLGVAEHLDVKDNSGRFEIAGVEDADKIRKDFWNTINSSEKVNVNLCVNEPVNEPVNERQQALLQIIEQNASVTREELSERLSISLATLKRDLALLRKNGYVARRGSDKTGQWILLKKK